MTNTQSAPEVFGHFGDFDNAINCAQEHRGVVIRDWTRDGMFRVQDTCAAPLPDMETLMWDGRPAGENESDPR